MYNEGADLVGHAVLVAHGERLLHHRRVLVNRAPDIDEGVTAGRELAHLLLSQSAVA